MVLQQHYSSFSKDFTGLEFFPCQITYKHESSFWTQWQLNDSELFWEVRYIQVSKKVCVCGRGCFSDLEDREKLGCMYIC